MRPSIPRPWLDLCIVPKHDEIGEAKNIIETEGTLSLAEHVQEKDEGSGIILIGGESPHYVWDDKSLLSQIKNVTQTSPTDIRWIVTDSRRTPKSFKSLLVKIDYPNIEYKDFSSLEPNWLANNLESSQYAWITPDSISMTYESLSAGCQVGIFDLSESRESRVTKNQLRLIKEEKIRTYYDKFWKPVQFLNERDRVGRLIVNRWPFLSGKQSQTE